MHEASILTAGKCKILVHVRWALAGEEEKDSFLFIAPLALAGSKSPVSLATKDFRAAI